MSTPEKKASNWRLGEKTRFKKGEVHNPGGRPKGSVSLTTILRRILREDPEQAEGIVRDWIEHSRKGNAAYLREMLERIEGKVKDVVEVDSPRRIQVTFGGQRPADSGSAETVPEAGSGDL